MSTDLRLVNDMSAPVQDDRLGRPDLTLLGVNTVPYHKSWRVDNSVFSFSDNRYIVFVLCLTPTYRAYERYKTKNKSMCKFNRVFAEKYDVIYSSSGRVRDQASLEEWIDGFSDYLQECTKKCLKEVICHTDHLFLGIRLISES